MAAIEWSKSIHKVVGEEIMIQFLLFMTKYIIITKLYFVYTFVFLLVYMYVCTYDCAHVCLYVFTYAKRISVHTFVHIWACFSAFACMSLYICQ